MKYSKRIISLILAMILMLLLTSCQWFNTEEPHECESACSECGKCLDIECQEEACADKCPGHHKCERVCESCEGCLDAECGEEACLDKCSCHIKETLCPECGGCVYTGCKETICMQKCSCSKCVNVDEEIVAALSDHLDHINAEYELAFFNTEKKINYIKYGIFQPLMVTFDSVKTYYVAVYFSGEHHTESSFFLENALYCCLEDYVWVRFESVEDITKTYNNRNILTAFVILEMESVSNILSEDAEVPEFVIFDTVSCHAFTDEKIQAPNISSAPFIYLYDEKQADTVYYDASEYSNHIITLPCVKIDEKYYVMFRKLSINGQDIANDFGKYYTKMSEVMSTEIYTYTNEYGNILECYLIELEDFVKILKEE